MTEPKEIKQEIRRYRKLKLQCRPGSVERLDLEHKIKDLKGQLAKTNIPEPDKDIVIAEILKLETDKNITPRFEDLDIDLHKYTLEQLKFHLEKLKKR